MHVNLNELLFFTNKSKKLYIMRKLLLLLVLFAPASIFAQAYQLNLQGTRQIGKGSTGLAQPTDATSLFTNPGSAVFLESNDITVGITPAISKGRFTDANTNAVSESDNPVKPPFNASAVFGNAEGNWRFGISIFTPFGSPNKWKEGSAGRFEIKEIDLLSVSFQPTVSYKINDKLGIGVGLAYTFGTVDIQRDLPVQFPNGSFADTQIKSDAHGFNVNAGLYYRASDKVSLALTYRSPLDMKSSGGKATFNVPASLQGNFPNQDIKATLPLPQIFGIGVSYKPAEEWVVNAEAYLSDWHHYDEIDIEFQEAPVAGEESTTLLRHYKQGYSFRGGVEYLPNKKYELRAGFIVSLSPIKEAYVSPDVPDGNRINPTIGGSYKFSDKFRMDAALLMEFIHRTTNTSVAGINGTYNYDLFFPSIGLTYSL